MSRPVIFDFTHLINRLSVNAPSGIDRVDLAYARHCLTREGGLAGAAHYAADGARVFPKQRLHKIVGRIESRWGERIDALHDPGFLQARDWIGSGTKVGRNVVPFKPPIRHLPDVRGWMESRIQPLRNLRSKAPPPHALYLNIAQHEAESEVYFKWLGHRRDVQGVFFLHDLLPLERPEFWWPGHEVLFERRVKTIFTYASALIVSTEEAKDHVQHVRKMRGLPMIPVFCAPLPSAFDASAVQALYDPVLARENYFVILGTIEPRKNHQLLLDIWRQWLSEGREPPKLLMIGKRGWENRRVFDALDMDERLRPFLIEVNAMSNAGVARMLANACALLMPSFAEGYGLPLVEALSLGTPIIASDIPVFHEVTGGTAIYAQPDEAERWRAAILALADRASQTAIAARAAAQNFQTPRAADYFIQVENFLATL